MELSPEMCIGGRELTEPRLSPDGRRVAFVSRWAGGPTAIVEVPVGGGPERLLTVPGAIPAAGRGLGGGCWDWLPDGGGVIFAATDGELWLQPWPGGPTRRLTDHGAGSVEGPAVLPDGSAVAYVRDQAEVWLCRIVHDASGTSPAAPGDPVRLDDGSADFVLDPVPMPSGDTVQWQAWSVPDMPWDGAYIARAAVDGSPRDAVRGAGAIQQPRATPTGELVSVRDDHGWLNVWIGDRPVVDEPFEHAGPTWGSGQRSFAVSPDGTQLAFCRNEAGFGRLCVVEIGSGEVREVARGVHGALSWRGDHLVAIRSGARTPTQVVAYSTATWERTVLAVGPVSGWEAADLPEPELLEVTRDDVVLHARRYVAGHGRTICWAHGGPVDQWQVEFNPRIAYWWSQGWDILVADPRGTTGHGRAYQQALRGEWGRIDVDDTAAVLAESHRRGLSDPSRTAVIGGSSGGLVVLGVLANHRGLAAGGVALYPVTDLADLAEHSHRYEAHAGLTLVGPPDDTVAYAARSPLSVADRIDVPLVVLHGDSDPVVPLSHSQELVERVTAAGGDVALHVFEGEGHGFRRPEHKLAEYRLVGELLERVAAYAPTRALREQQPR